MPVRQGREVSPATLSASGRLYLALPLAHTRENLCVGLAEAKIDYQTHEGELLSFDLSPGVLERFNREACRRLSSVERQDSRSLIVASGGTPQLADLMRTQSLERLGAQIEGRWLDELLAEGRLTTYFQPIVDCSDPACLLGYECLLRGLQPSGELIFPDRLYQTARDTGSLHQLDLAARLKAIESAARHQIEGLVFINFDPAAVYDPAFCLQSAIEAIEGSDLARDQFVFEAVQSDRTEDERHLRKIFESFRAAGFRVALDNVGAGYSSLNLVSKLTPDYIKLDMDLIRDADHDPVKAQIGGKLLKMARGLEIPTIAEGVETEAEWLWLRDHGASFAQGYYFGRPAAAPNRPRLTAAFVE
jgi:EAL domain-containing protein (putative c-di-GMP-specific phosphodiesterase class I)